MHKVGDTVFKSNGTQYDRGTVVRVNGNKALVNFGTHVATVSMKVLCTQKQIRRRTVR